MSAVTISDVSSGAGTKRGRQLLSYCSWISNELAAIKTRKAELRLIACLRRLDAQLLDDIGVDQVALRQPTPRLRLMSADSNGASS
jgi:hypothetical protein